MENSQKMTEDTENMTNQITMEEHFVQPEQAKKDPNAVYIEDNPQKALEKLRNLANNENFREKIQYVKHLAELTGVIGDEGIAHLKEIITSIQEDNDEIKRALLTQITPLVTLLKSRGEAGYQEIIDIIVPTVSHLINSVNYDIKDEAGQELAKIAPLLNEDDRGKHLLTVVLGMAHDDDNEENRMIAVRLLSEMAHLFGKDLCEQFVGLEFLSMGEDPQLRVRKEAVSNLPSIGKIVSAYFFRQRLLPFYLKLCKDANWGVRKSCIDTLYEISNICKEESIEIRENELTEAMNNFLKDSNKWVKISAYKSLGPFIFTLTDQNINEKLIDSYLHMADSNINNLSPDNEIIYACAYNFPAVVLTLGPARWPLLSKLFQSLLKSGDKIRKPLACALHEIAKIIGEEHTEKDLLSALESFLKDPNDEIKYGALQSLALFLQVFSVEKRENMVDIFVQLQKDQKKWRIRELIARQIDKLTLIFSPKITFEIIAPISFKLCNDPVSFVREEAARKIYSILKALSDANEAYRDSIIENVKGFSQSNRFTNRQSFIAMCEKIMKDADLFINHFLVDFAPLAQDKVANVRIAVAKALEKAFKKDRPVRHREEILQLIARLRNDTSKDVKNIIEGIIADHNLSLENFSQKINQESNSTEVTSVAQEAEENKTEQQSQLEKQAESPSNENSVHASESSNYHQVEEEKSEENQGNQNESEAHQNKQQELESAISEENQQSTKMEEESN